MKRNVLKLAGGFLLMVVAVGANAQIIYRDISPDKVINFSDYELNVGSSPDSCHLYPSQNVKISLLSGGGYVYWQTDGRVLVDVQGRARALNAGDPVDGNWASNGQALLCNGVGNWVAVNNKYLGVRIRKDGQWYNGWVRMDVGANGTYGVVKDYGYNTQPDGPILAGQVVATGIRAQDNLDAPSGFVSGKILNIKGVTEVATVAVVSIDGKVLVRQQVDSDAAINLSHLAQGLYVVHVNSVRGKTSFKIMLG